MSCNLINNEAELCTAFEAVSNSQSGNEWAIYEYDANSNIVKLGSTGNVAGFPELLENFDSGKVQYGFGTIAGNVLSGQNSQGQRKQGEGVPAARLATTVSHVEEIRRFIRRVNLTIYARNDEDLNRETLAKHFEKLQEIAPDALGNETTTNNAITSPQMQPSISTPFVPPTPIGTVYQKPKPKEETDMEEREKFWNEMRNEEELRRKEEGERRRQMQEQFVREQKDLATQIHKLHLKKLETQKMQHPQMEKSLSLDGTGSEHPKKGKLIAGRTQMFEEKMAELASSVKPMKKPKNFKWQVSLQGNLSSTPVNRVPEPPPKQFECVLKRKEQLLIEIPGGNDKKKTAIEQPPQEPTINKILPINPVPPISRQQPPTSTINQREETLKAAEENGNKYDCPSSPMSNGKISSSAGNVDEIRAKALWDYQAEDQTELSFNPDDVITQIQMVHDGWWYGRAPNGMMGLFPSNYVQLI